MMSAPPLLRVLLCFLLLLLSVAAKRSQVVVLSDALWDSEINNPTVDLWVVSFYAPWCGHCKKLEPVLRQTALELATRADGSAEADPIIAKIGKYDATANKEVAKRFGVSAYPTVLYFRREADTGKELHGRYEGARTKEGLLAFVDRMTMPHLTTIDSLEDVKNHHYNGHIVFLLTVPRSLEAAEKGAAAPVPALTLFETCAKNLQAHAAFLLLYSDSSDTAITLQKIESGNAWQGGVAPRLFMRTAAAGDAGTDISSSTYSQMALFIHNNNRPLISVFDNHNFKILGSLHRVMAIATYNTAGVTQASAHASLVEIVTQLTEEERDGYVFGVLDAHKWRGFIREHSEGLLVPRVLLLDLEKELFLAGESVDRVVRSHLQGTEKLQAIPRKSFFRRLRDKLAYYYPWSLLFVAVPVVLAALSLYLGVDEGDRKRRAERKRK